MRAEDIGQNDLGKEALKKKSVKLELNTITAEIIPDNSQSMRTMNFASLSSDIEDGNENRTNVSLLNLNRDQENILNQIFLPK